MHRSDETKNIALTILVLEDSRFDLELIEAQLSDAGFLPDITHAENEITFTAALREKKFDMILSDFSLPGFDAYGALKIAREICPTVPFICVSGYIDEANTLELRRQGAFDYVPKDRAGRLPDAIKRALDKAGRTA